ncbi:hypothetical protein ATANTOWER_022999 [Ataeniobius toweri]|uniref:Uncharacterized protein n=1 Tax=Ataeniobius toweri TaxID=208326 RepID=A0ABU7BXI6_9TELE|nr:hypothetical protein [Ataeniobius toweri]
MYNSLRKKGAKIIQRNTERSDSHLPDRFSGAAAGYWRRKQLSVSVRMKEYKSPRELTADCAPAAACAKTGDTAEDFHQYRPDIWTQRRTASSRQPLVLGRTRFPM